MKSPPRYAPEQPDQLIVHRLDALTLVYHRRSGQTHMVVSPVPEILAALPSGGATVAEAIAILAEDFDVGNVAEAEGIMAAQMSEMMELGLVRRA